MILDFGFLCHQAQQEQNRLDASGIGFDRLDVPGVPCSLDSMFYVVQVRAPGLSEPRHPFRLTMTRADGSVLYELDGTLDLRGLNSAGEPTARVIFGLSEVQFPDYGTYALRFEVAGRAAHQAQLTVRPQPAGN